MMKKRLAVLALMLAPVAASAQMNGPPPIPMAVQRTGSPSPAGITVVGTGRVTTPVKTLRFVAYVRGTPDEAGALAAMRAAGIEEPSLGGAGNFSFGPQQNGAPTMLRGVVRNVTPERLAAIGRAAAAYVLAHPGSNVDNVQFFARLDDCAAVEQRARSAAFADARRRADAIASTAGVSIAGVIDVAESGGCASYAEGDQPVDVGVLTTNVYVTERITYGIAPSAPTQRRPL